MAAMLMPHDLIAMNVRSLNIESNADWVLNFVAGGVLALAIGVNLYGWQRRSNEAAPPDGLGGIAELPLSVAGWSVQDLPLGPTEAVREAAGQWIGRGSVVHRSYTRGTVRFSVFAATWPAGGIPVRTVASHTPDRCWTEAGWECREMAFGVTRPELGRSVVPAEYRLFANGPDAEHVFYWHFVDGDLYDYGERFNRIPDFRRWLGDAIFELRHGNPAQHFVRINSNTPFERLREDPGFRVVVNSLASFGI